MSLLDLGEKPLAEAQAIVLQFVQQCSDKFSFPEFGALEKEKISAGLCEHFEKSQSQSFTLHCLSSIRIISRDKEGIDSLVSERLLLCLENCAGLICVDNTDPEVILEALKCLSNLSFNSEKARRYLCQEKVLSALVGRLLVDGASVVSQPENILFTVKLLFILTALCADIRPRVRLELHGFERLVKLIEAILFVAATTVDEALNVRLLDEVLKAIFNLTMHYKSTQLSEVECQLVERLVLIARVLLSYPLQAEIERTELRSNVVNLLTTLPSSCYVLLLEEGQAQEMKVRNIPYYQGFNMAAIDSILEFLYQQVDAPLKEQVVSLSPVLILLTEMARSNKIIRKFLRFKILPPLKDVMNRPEEGDTYRNKLVRLMTSVTDVKDLAADFLYVLCKQSVDRLIKYTGFGNAAGMLSRHGLLGGVRPNADASDEENSDTEEYNRVKNQINPITGCFEGKMPNPLEGMSEEQKEYEVMKIVNLLDKMTRDGAIKPGTIGPDGRVIAVEHVLQMQEGRVDPSKFKEDDCSDSD